MLEAVLARATLIGIDVPLGWPTPFVDAIAAHHRFEAWPGAMGDERRLFFRATDRFVWSQTGRPPLSVAADRIAWPAVRAARLLSRLSGRRGQDRSGAGGTLVEVYPAGALFRWTNTHPHYKGAGGAVAVRAAAKMLFRPWVRYSDSASAELYQADEDCFDALVCSFVARAHAKGLCEIRFLPRTQKPRGSRGGSPYRCLAASTSFRRTRRGARRRGLNTGTR